MTVPTASARDTAMADIDRVLSHSSDTTGMEAVYELSVILRACVDRWAPPGSVYRITASERADRDAHLHLPARAALRALRRDIEAGAVHRYEELINAGVLADIIEQGEHLLENGYAQAAVVLFGGALEEHLRKLCNAWSVPLLNARGEPQKASMLNDQLAKSGAYTKPDHDMVAAWLKIRNLAAHSKPELSNHTADELRMMAQGIRGVIARYPA